MLRLSAVLFNKQRYEFFSKSQLYKNQIIYKDGVVQ